MKKRKVARAMRHPKDVALGARIRELRERSEPRVSQAWLAREINVSMQQIQKYESGANRIAWSRLCEIAAALNIGVVQLIEPLL